MTWCDLSRLTKTVSTIRKVVCDSCVRLYRRTIPRRVAPSDILLSLIARGALAEAEGIDIMLLTTDERDAIMAAMRATRSDSVAVLSHVAVIAAAPILWRRQLALSAQLN